MYVQVNVGRNWPLDENYQTTNDGQPMSLVKWREFQGMVRKSLRNNSVGTMPTGTVDIHLGSGHWKNELEESAHISAFWEPGFYITQLREDLDYLKDLYGQETIALIIGSELV